MMAGWPLEELKLRRNSVASAEVEATRRKDRDTSEFHANVTMSGQAEAAYVCAEEADNRNISITLLLTIKPCTGRSERCQGANT